MEQEQHIVSEKEETNSLERKDSRISRISFSTYEESTKPRLNWNKAKKKISVVTKMRPNAKRRLKSFLQHTTFHGLDEVFRTEDKRARVFWIMVVVCVVLIVVLQLKKMIYYFITNPSVTSLHLNLPEDGIDFPSFTICPLLKMNWTKLNDTYPNMPQRVAEFATGSFFSAYSTALVDIYYFSRHNPNNSGLEWESLQEEFNNVTGNQTIYDFMKNITFECRGQFLACWFENGAVFSCCEENKFFTVKRYLVHSGPCFEFKPTNGLKQRLPGPVGGFGFVYWYPNSHILGSAFNAYTEHGIQLYTSPTEAMLEKNPTVIQVGTHAHIGISATKTRRLTTDQLGRETCVPRKLKYFKEYSYASCQVECLIGAMMDHCGCMGLSTFPSIPHDKFCSPEQAFHCFRDVAYNFTDLLNGCRRTNCSEACVYWSYKPSLTASRIFNPSIADDMQKYWRLPNDSRANMALVIADVYFDEIQYTEVVQVPALTFESFVSNIGGAMGLWTGASIITWIHLIFFCCSACCVQRKEAKAKRLREMMMANPTALPHGRRPATTQRADANDNTVTAIQLLQKGRNRRRENGDENMTDTKVNGIVPLAQEEESLLHTPVPTSENHSDINDDDTENEV